MKAQRGSRYETLDALRGVAILAVILLHFGDRARTADDQLIHARIWPLFSHGYLGVQLFFVISGYCITAAMYAASRNPHPLRHFLHRRARRIFPPYWCSIILVVGMGAVTCLLMRKHWSDVFPLTAVDWGLNLVLLQMPFGAPDASEVYWSLSVEIQFYAVMALCLLKSEWTELFLMAISIGSMILLGIPTYPISGTIFAYWPEFACGIAVYYFVTGCNRVAMTPWCLLATAAGAAFMTWRLDSTLFGQYGHLALPYKIVFCLLIALFLVRLHPYDIRLARSPFTRWLTTLGLISYSLYLTHIPISARVFNLGERMTGLGGQLWLLYACIAFVLVIAVGARFFRYFERPFINDRIATFTVPKSSKTHAEMNKALTPALMSAAEHTFFAPPLRPDSIIVDLGANRGEFSQLMHQSFGCNCYLVEANPVLADYLSQTQCFPVFSCAVSDVDGSIAFNLAHNDRGSSVLPLPTTSTLGCICTETIAVPARRLPSLLAEIGHRKVDLIKMDIEGAEMAVLNDMPPELLANIGQLTVEFHGHPIFGFALAPQVEAQIRRLSQLGFLCLDISLGARMDVLFVNQALHHIPIRTRISWYLRFTVPMWLRPLRLITPRSLRQKITSRIRQLLNCHSLRPAP